MNDESRMLSAAGRDGGNRRTLGKGRQVPARGVLSKLAWGWALLIMLLPLGACDFIAQKTLVAGESTEADVRRWMGQPDLVWEEEDGSRVLEYPRGPMGLETYFVSIGADGRYRRIEQVLTPENFGRLKPGMDRDQVRQILGRPAEKARFSLSKEEVWSWRHKAPDTSVMYFNAHFHQESGLLKRTDTVVDWKREGAP
ncbi:MAG: outer membrane protein assembly factor BamE [Lautropia sp.]|nr:outer membrane protein assembly factor BamE [Lautropia sp.]